MTEYNQKRNFDELFSELKGLHSKPNKLLFSEKHGLTRLFTERVITNYCISKQRVREAISKRRRLMASHDWIDHEAQVVIMEIWESMFDELDLQNGDEK